MRKKGVFLEYSVEIALVGREGGNILSVKQNLSLVGGLKSADNAQGGCLAAAGRTEQCDEFILTDIETQIVQDDIVTVGFGNVHKIDQFFAHSVESFLIYMKNAPACLRESDDMLTLQYFRSIRKILCHPHKMSIDFIFNN